MSYVVTGATGQLGRLVVESLLERGIAPAEIVATGRSVEKLSDLAERGVRVERLDFETIGGSEVIAAGDVVLLVSGNEVGRRVPQHVAVLQAAVAAGARRIVYTSAPSADDTTLVLAPEHAATEEAIRASGLPFTMLRNGWYHENFQQAFAQAAETGAIVDSVGDGRIASASRADLADAAAVVLSTDGHDGRTYELSGDRAWGYDELASTFAAALGRPVVRQQVSPEEHRALLVAAGLDEGTAGFVVALDQNTAEGVLSVTTGELSKLIERPTAPLADTVGTWATA